MTFSKSAWSADSSQPLYSPPYIRFLASLILSFSISSVQPLLYRFQLVAANGGSSSPAQRTHPRGHAAKLSEWPAVHTFAIAPSLLLLLLPNVAAAGDLVGLESVPELVLPAVRCP